MRVVRARRVVDVDGEAVLERQPAVPGDVVGVRVRLEDGRQPDAASLRLFEVLLDPVCGVDYDRNAGVLVTDEVGGAAEIVVDELLEQHRSTLAPDTAISLEVSSPA